MLFSYIFHIKPLILFFKSPEVIFSYTFFLNVSPLKAELIRIYANIFVNNFTNFYDLNTNVNSWYNNILWLYRNIWWTKITPCVKSCFKEKYKSNYMGPSWSWSYGSWIYNYQCNQCLSSQKLWVRIPVIARCTGYNIKWSSLAVTWDRSVVFFGYSDFLHQ
jgi:hypothetical protein